MNENIDLTKILKDCPEGFKLYTPLMGEVVFIKVGECTLSLPVRTLHSSGIYLSFTKEGYYFNFNNKDAECLLFPSKDQRDWSKFTAPWLKKKKFDPKTLKPFDKVLVRDSDGTALLVEQDETRWKCALYSHERGNESIPYKYATTDSPYVYCIPYNEDTKHLVGTTEEAPEFYRYWED